MAGGTAWSKKGIGKSTKVEQLRIVSVPFLEVLKNPPRWLLRKPALTGTADDYRNHGHIVLPSGCGPGTIAIRSEKYSHQT
jgi:hypothetical protein